jgi:hypothetical protein
MMEDIVYILSPGEEITDGVYASKDYDGNNEVVIFENIDDVERYRIQLEAIDFPTSVIEIPKEEIITYCELSNFQYVIITKDELVFPRYETLISLDL